MKSKKITDTLVIVDAYAIDYITLTSYAPWLLDVGREWLMGECERMKYPFYDGGKEGYRGVVCEFAFSGTGVQRGRAHYMVQVSGGMADKFVRDAIRPICKLLASGHLNCSRLDIQYTRREIDSAGFPYLAERARILSFEGVRGIGGWKGNGRIPDCATNHSASGSTLYIGSRISERFTRIYQKSVSGDKYIRFEVEIKRKLARVILGYIVENGSVDEGIMAKFLSGEITRYPEELLLFVNEQFDLGGEPRTRISLEEGSLESTWHWLDTAVRSSLARMMTTEYSPLIEDLLRDMLNLKYAGDRDRGISP